MSGVIQDTLTVRYYKKANKITFVPSIFITKDHPPPLVLKFQCLSLFECGSLIVFVVQLSWLIFAKETEGNPLKKLHQTQRSVT